LFIQQARGSPLAKLILHRGTERAVRIRCGQPKQHGDATTATQYSLHRIPQFFEQKNDQMDAASKQSVKKV
jgi:hypothetical protein